MLTPYFFIESIQTTKKVVANYVFTDKVLNKTANDYIDAQTAFAKMLVNNSMEVSRYSAEIFAKYWFPKKEATA